MVHNNPLRFMPNANSDGLVKGINSRLLSAQKEVGPHLTQLELREILDNLVSDVKAFARVHKLSVDHHKLNGFDLFSASPLSLAEKAKLKPTYEIHQLIQPLLRAKDYFQTDSKFF